MSGRLTVLAVEVGEKAAGPKMQHADWVTTSTLLDGLLDFSNGEAWSRLADRFRAPIVHFAVGSGLPRDAAEDVAQETLVAFAEGYRAGRYSKERGRLSRWLFGIAYRQTQAARRSAARVDQGRDGDAAQLEDELHASERWDREWERGVLDVCLERTRAETGPQTYRAFELVVLGGKTPAEASAELRVPVKTVYNAKHRVLQRMREVREALEREA